MDAIKVFFNDPLVDAIWTLAIVSFAVFLLTVWRSWTAVPRQFDVTKLPQILRTMVLDKLVPLAIMGVSIKLVTDSATSQLLTVAYIGGCAAVLGAELKDFIAGVTGTTFPPDLEMEDITAGYEAPSITQPVVPDAVVQTKTAAGGSKTTKS